MSRTFTSRSVATQNRGRGTRGRGLQPSIVKLKSEPSLLKEEGSSPSVEEIKAPRPTYGLKEGKQQGVARGRASKREMWDPNHSSQPLGRPGYGGYGRKDNANRQLGQVAGYGRGQFGPPMVYGEPDHDQELYDQRKRYDQRELYDQRECYDQRERYDQREPAFNPAQPSRQPRGVQEDKMTHTGSYTVITPNPKKRQEILTQAERETREYEEHKLRNKPGQFSYVGTAGGGEFTSLEEARQQQMQLHKAQTSKTSRLIREEEKKRQQRIAQEAEFEKKKAAARQQTECNKQRLLQTDSSKDLDRRRVNDKFLDRMELESKQKAAKGSSGLGRGDNHVKAGGLKAGGLGRGEGDRIGAPGSWGVAGSRDSRSKPGPLQPATPTAAAAAAYESDRQRASKVPASTYTRNAGFSPASQGSCPPGNSTMPASRNPDIVSGNSRGSGYTSAGGGGNGVQGQQFYDGHPGNKTDVPWGLYKGFEDGGGDNSVWSQRGGVSTDMGRGDEEYDDPESGGDDGGVAHEEDYEEQLAVLQAMFPLYKPALLRDILQQLHGSVEEAAALLGE